MRDWLTTSELAALALPGLPATRGGWEALAEREGWESFAGKARPRKGRGGGFEYHVNLLPPVAIAQIAARAIGKVDLTPEDARAADDGQGFLPSMEGRDARLALVSAADRFALKGALSRNVADRLFASLYNRGEIEIGAWVKQSVRKISPGSLARWRQLKAAGKTQRLAVDRGGARRGKGALDAPEIRQFILSRVAHQPWLSASHVQGLLQANFPQFAGDQPPVRTVQHFLKGLKTKEAELLTRVTNPDKWNSKYRPTGVNSAPVARLNELWMIDASPADVLCVDGRHSVYLCIDIFSRRLVVYVSKTPRAEAVALLMRRAILAWGAPERVKTDNGSDFKAKSTQRLFAALEIEIELSAPFAPWQKGHIERAVKTFQHDCAAILPGFVGHNVADRSQIEERKAFAARLKEDDGSAFKVELCAKELQTICDEWAAARYAQRPHSGIGGATPFAMAASYVGKLRKVPQEDIRALDLLLAPLAGSDGLRVVQKQGVRIDHSFYLTPNCLPGDRVFVRMDPEDMGRAYLFAPDGDAFLGEAICPELAGVNPHEALAKAKAMRKELTEERLKALKADMRKISPREAVDALVRDKAKATGKLVEFPRAHAALETPALAAAREALGDAPASVSISAPSQEGEKIDMSAPVHKLPETKQQRFRRALALENALARSERIDTEDALWLGAYQAGPEYRAMREIYEDFGEAALR